MFSFIVFWGERAIKHGETHIIDKPDELTITINIMSVEMNNIPA